MQVTIKLKEMLQNFGVRVIVRTFEEDRGIEGLGENPFVSFKLSPVQIVLHTQVYCQRIYPWEGTH